MTQLAFGTKLLGRWGWQAGVLGVLRLSAGWSLGRHEEVTGLLQFVTVGRAAQSIGADFDKSLGQDVAQEAADKFLGA